MTESGVQREHGNLSSKLLPFYFLAACCKCKLDLNFWIWCIKMTSWSWHWNYGKESAYWQSKLNHRERQKWEQPGLIAQAGSLAFFICQRPQECSGGNSLDPAQQLMGSSWKLGKQRLTQPTLHNLTTEGPSLSCSLLFLLPYSCYSGLNVASGIIFQNQ